jgi:hypothetical protein
MDFVLAIEFTLQRGDTRSVKVSFGQLPADCASENIGDDPSGLQVHVLNRRDQIEPHRRMPASNASAIFGVLHVRPIARSNPTLPRSGQFP